MADVVDRKTRSRMMAGIQGKNTKPELVVRRYLHGKGLRFRLHARELPGKPDLVFPRYRVAVFVNGCFWHQHGGCRLASFPASNQAFWQEKLGANVTRDQRNRKLLQASGWHVITIWECDLSETKLADVAAQIREQKT